MFEKRFDQLLHNLNSREPEIILSALRSLVEQEELTRELSYKLASLYLNQNPEIKAEAENLVRRFKNEVLPLIQDLLWHQPANVRAAELAKLEELFGSKSDDPNTADFGAIHILKNIQTKNPSDTETIVEERSVLKIESSKLNESERTLIDWILKGDSSKFESINIKDLKASEDLCHVTKWLDNYIRQCELHQSAYFIESGFFYQITFDRDTVEHLFTDEYSSKIKVLLEQVPLTTEINQSLWLNLFKLHLNLPNLLISNIAEFTKNIMEGDLRFTELDEKRKCGLLRAISVYAIKKYDQQAPVSRNEWGIFLNELLVGIRDYNLSINKIITFEALCKLYWMSEGSNLELISQAMSTLQIANDDNPIDQFRKCLADYQGFDPRITNHILLIEQILSREDCTIVNRREALNSLRRTFNATEQRTSDWQTALGRLIDKLYNQYNL